MNIGKYTLVDGKFILSDDFRISYSDSICLTITEKIRAVRTNMPFFSETLEIIRLKLELYNQTFPEFTEKEGTEFKRQLERTLTKNKHFLGAVLHVNLRILNHKISYSIQSEKLTETDFELNEKGLYVATFGEIPKPISAISHLSAGSELFWNIAKAHNQDPLIDRILILDSQDHILEVPESNIYFIKDDRVYSPNMIFGAYLDITQPYVLEIVKSLNLKFNEDQPVSIQNMREADEVFIVNAVEGIRWIIGFEGKRYYNTTTRKILERFSRGLIQ